MQRSLIVLFLFLLLCAGIGLFAVQEAYASGDFAGGTGTAEDPYLVATAEQLNRIRGDHLDKHFRLIANINLGVAPWNEGEGWEPIGISTVGSRFTGSFDGGGYVIYNLTLSRSAAQYQGLFGFLDGAVIENLRLENVSILGGSKTGALAGQGNNIVIEQVRVSGEVKGGNDTGGLAGLLSGGSLHYTSSSAAVEGGSYTGGLVGRSQTVSIRHSFSQGTVEGGYRTGGLVGEHSWGSSIVDCYSRAEVEGGSSNQIGGLVGHMSGSNTRLYRSYSTGQVKGTGSDIGGLVGNFTGGTVANSYWDSESSGQELSAAGEAKTTAEMQQQATYKSYNFYTLWQINEGAGYPIFQDLSGYGKPQAVDLNDLDGDGSAGNPYIITTASELNAMRQDLAAHYRLGSSIDLAASVAWNEGEGWEPIGISASRFTGSFDGGGYVIYNLTLSRPAAQYQGLFGFLDGAVIENLRLENVSILGGSNTGALAGQGNNIVIEQVRVSGEVKGGNDTGGLTGLLSGGSLHYTSSSAAVEGGSYTGGLVGRSQTVSIRHSFSQGTVEGGYRTGGLVGEHSWGSSIVDCYSQAEVEGGSSNQIGGLVGHMSGSNTRLYRSYSTGQVKGTGSDIGGLVGNFTGGTVVNSYWDSESSGQELSAVGEAKTTAEMQQQATYKSYNFYTLWQINEGAGYPIFQDLSGYGKPQAVDLNDLDGDGSAGNPYIITTASELNAMRQDLAAHYRLGSSIDLAASVAWNEGEGWEPIGISASRFTGSFDGAGYVIYNLTVSRPAAQGQGLFGFLDGAVIENLGLENVNVLGWSNTGALAGWVNNTGMESIFISGQVCGTGSYTGGLAGLLHDTSWLHYSRSAAAVLGQYGTGGLVGGTSAGVAGGSGWRPAIRHSWSLGAVEGADRTGGLVGTLNSGYIADCYSQSPVNGENRVGGLVGYTYHGIYRSFSTGSVSGSGEDVGGLVGLFQDMSGYDTARGTVLNSYWDIQTSGQASSSAGIGKTTAEMQQYATYKNYNFYTLWQITEGVSYPTFQDLNNYSKPQAINLADLDGDGSEDNPYIITTASELNAMRQDLEAHYRLGNNLDLSETVAWNYGAGWQPVGTSTVGSRFTGSIDGNGYTISYLALNRPKTQYQGLFGYTHNAPLNDIALRSINILGGRDTGGIAGVIAGGTFSDPMYYENLSVTGQVFAACVGSNASVGGITSSSGSSYSNISNSYTAVSVQGSAYTGGLVGYNGGAIQRSYSLGTVQCTSTTGYLSRTGGLVGYMSHSHALVGNSYSRAAVSGTDHAGGLIGRYAHGCKIINSYSSGPVIGAGENVGGLLGSRSSADDGTVTASFWDIQASGQAESAAGIGKTTAEMKKQATFPWIFTTIWSIEEDISYPNLQQVPRVISLNPALQVHRNDASAGDTFSVLSNADWNATSNDGWITITAGHSGSNDGTVTYSVEANPAPGTRTGTITISSGSVASTFTVRQGAFLNVAPSSLSHDAFSSSGHVLSVNSNVAWNTAANDSWIIITAGSTGAEAGMVTYSITENNSLNPRTGSISISGGGLSSTVTVNQAGAIPYLSIGPQYREHGAFASSGHTIAVTSNSAWNASATESWINITGGSVGNETGVVTYELELNPGRFSRQGTITVSDGSKTLFFRIVQAPLPVDKPASSNANLASLMVTPGEIEPVFEPDILAYTADVAYGVATVDITAILSDENAALEIAGNPATSGDPETIALGAAGTATVIEVEVTAEDGATTKTYLVTVNRAEEPAGPTWRNLTTADAQALAYDGGVLAASVEGFGIGLYDGNDWVNLTTATALALATDGSTLVASVEGFGIWAYDGGWSQLTPFTADLIAVDNGMIAASFADHGIWLFDGNDWTNLTPVPALALAFDSGRLAASVDIFGTWLYDGLSWTQLTAETAQHLALSGSNIAASFDGFGIWFHDGHTWDNLTPVPALALALDKGILAVSVEVFGTWLNDGQWNNILAATADLLASDDGKVAASFEGAGVWLYE